jgi:hypothetical protein
MLRISDDDCESPAVFPPRIVAAVLPGTVDLHSCQIQLVLELQHEYVGGLFLVIADAPPGCRTSARHVQQGVQLASTMLMAGLDPRLVTIYRRSDVPELTAFADELCALLGLSKALAADFVHSGSSSLCALDIVAVRATHVLAPAELVPEIAWARAIVGLANHVCGEEAFPLPTVRAEWSADRGRAQVASDVAPARIDVEHLLQQGAEQMRLELADAAELIRHAVGSGAPAPGICA